MRFQRLDLNLLVALDALLTERNVSRAAERLNLTQSAMSNALARLRSYFDDPLLVQIGRRLEPTPRADLLQSAVRDVLVRIEASIATRPSFDAEKSDREFRILVSDYSAVVLMPHVVALAHRAAPGIRFKLLPQIERPHHALESGEIDLLVMPREFCAPEHPVDVIYGETFDCVVWAGGRFADGPLSLADFQSAGHVVLQPSQRAETHEAITVRRLGLERRIEVSTFSFVSVPHLVVGTDRIATMHARLAAKAAVDLPIVVKPVPFPIPEMQQAMQWHAYRTQDSGLVWLRDLFRSAAALTR